MLKFSILFQEILDNNTLESDNADEIVETFQELKNVFDSLIFESELEFNISNMVFTLEGHLIFVDSMLSNVCGTRTNSVAYRNTVDLLKNQLASIKTQFDTYISQNQKDFDTFNKEAFPMIVEEFYVENSTDSLLADYMSF